MKKTFFALAIFFIAILTMPVFAAAANVNDANTVCAYFFYSDFCPYCSTVENFLQKMEAKYPSLDVNRLDANAQSEFLNRLYAKFNVPKYVTDQYGNSLPVWGQVPIVFIGKEYFIGAPPITSKTENEILKHAKKGIPCPDQNLEAYPDENTNLPGQNQDNLGKADSKNLDTGMLIIIGAAILILIAAVSLALLWRKNPEEKKPEKKSQNKQKQAQKKKNKKPRKKKG